MRHNWSEGDITQGAAQRGQLWNRSRAMNLTAVYMKVVEGYVAFVEELPGANTQGETLEEARENLKEAVTVVLEANRTMAEESLQGAAVTRETFTLPLA